MGATVIQDDADRPSPGGTARRLPWDNRHNWAGLIVGALGFVLTVAGIYLGLIDTTARKIDKAEGAIIQKQTETHDRLSVQIDRTDATILQKLDDLHTAVLDGSTRVKTSPPATVPRPAAASNVTSGEQIRGALPKSQVGPASQPTSFSSSSRFWGFLIPTEGKRVRIALSTSNSRVAASVMYELREFYSARAFDFGQYDSSNFGATQVLQVDANFSFGAVASCRNLQVLTLSYQLHDLQTVEVPDYLGKIAEDGCIDESNSEDIIGLEDRAIKRSVGKMAADTATYLLSKTSVR